MIKKLLIPAGLFFLTLISCNNKHEHEVTVVLYGDQVHRHVLNQPYTDPGAYGVDWMNKQLPVTVDASALNVNLCGYYPVKISATDEFGNTGTTERTVLVYNEAEYLQGNWSCYKYFEGQGIPDTIYIEKINVSTDKNRYFRFTSFSSYANADVLCYLEANLIYMDSLEYMVGPGQNTALWFSGDGLQVNSNRLDISYSETSGGNTEKFTALVTRE